ncbi:T9SS type A sorting domain-containing protein [Calditrichota bacterium GD2]
MLKFLIFSFIPILLFAQNPRDYFPTHLGDMWQYINSDGNYVNYTIVKDSIDSSGNEYVDFEISWVGYTGSYIKHYVIDTLDQVWRLDEGSYEKGKAILYNLRSTYGEWYYCGNYANGLPFYARVIDTTTHSKTYNFYESSAEDGDPDSITLDGSLIILEAGIGRTYVLGEFFSEHLNGAIIDGVQYGTIYYDTTAIAEPEVNLLPMKPEILKTYPNPFNSRVKIEYFLPEPSRLKIEIFNISGQKVNTLFNGYARKGKKEIIWNGVLFSQQLAPSGLYIVKLTANGFKDIKRVLLVK